VGEDGMMNSFMFGKASASHWQQNMGVEIFVSVKRSIIAALFVREHGDPYQDIITKAQATGRMPKAFKTSSILAPTPPPPAD
jgi:hypothetical protein